MAQRGSTHDDMVAARLLEHVRDELRGDGCAALVLLVLARVREEREDGGDALRARDFAGMDHYADLHERGVDLAAPGVDDVHVVLAHGLDHADLGLPDPAFRDVRLAQGDTEPADEERSALAL